MSYLKVPGFVLRDLWIDGRISDKQYTDEVKRRQKEESAKDEEIVKLREALKPFAKIAYCILSEAPPCADYCSLYQDCEGVSHRVTMDECRALVKAAEL